MRLAEDRIVGRVDQLEPPEMLPWPATKNTTQITTTSAITTSQNARRCRATNRLKKCLL